MTAADRAKGTDLAVAALGIFDSVTVRRLERLLAPIDGIELGEQHGGPSLIVSSRHAVQLVEAIEKAHPGSWGRYMDTKRSFEKVTKGRRRP